MRSRNGSDPNADSNVHDEVFALLDAGAPALFADYPDAAVEAREDWITE